MDDEFVERIASRVAGLLRTEPMRSNVGSVSSRVEQAQAAPIERSRRARSPARSILASRRRREDYFDPSLFADPAWDILLDLYAAGQEGALVSVSSLCIAAAVPPTTALRWIVRLEAVGIICRSPDPFDRRRDFLELSTEARDKMEALLLDDKVI